jgi:DNA invertase Pin-like site-specific DNA recombinase
VGEFVGQRLALEPLLRVLQGALARAEPMQHLLFTGESGTGKSLAAQTLAQVAKAETCHYTLDKTLRADEGRSGYHGRHVNGKGSLGRFLSLVEANAIPVGSALVVENLDRFSRMNINQSIQLARRLLEKGIDIVTLLPEDKYTGAGLSDAMTWMKLVMYFERAHQESKMKAARTGENWGQARKKIAAGVVVGGSHPFWLDLVDGKWVPNHKAAWVKQLFRWADQGIGVHTLAKRCAERGWSFKRAAWPTQTTIWRLLMSRTVLGEFTPRHRDGAAAGDPVPDYYPAIIAPDLWHRVQAIIKDPARRKLGGRAVAKVTNLFTGLIVDVRDKSKVYCQKKRTAHYLVSHAALHGQASWVGFRYDAFEKAMLRAVKEIDPESLRPAGDGAEEVRELEGKLAEACVRVKRAEARVDTAKDEAEEEVAHQSLTRAVRRRKGLGEQLEAARSKASSQPVRQMERLQAVLKMASDPEGRQQLRGLIAALVKKVEVLVQKRGRYERRCWVTIRFHCGVVRQLMITGSGAAMTWVCGEGEDGWVVEHRVST